MIVVLCKYFHILGNLLLLDSVTSIALTPFATPRTPDSVTSHIIMSQNHALNDWRVRTDSSANLCVQ
jgi:hypothetical protein